MMLFFQVFEESRQNSQSTENVGIQAIQVSHKQGWSGRRIARLVGTVTDKGGSAADDLYSAPQHGYN